MFVKPPFYLAKSVCLDVWAGNFPKNHLVGTCMLATNLMATKQKPKWIQKESKQNSNWQLNSIWKFSNGKTIWGFVYHLAVFILVSLWISRTYQWCDCMHGNCVHDRNNGGGSIWPDRMPMECRMQFDSASREWRYCGVKVTLQCATMSVISVYFQWKSFTEHPFQSLPGIFFNSNTLIVLVCFTFVGRRQSKQQKNGKYLYKTLNTLFVHASLPKLAPKLGRLPVYRRLPFEVLQ